MSKSNRNQPRRAKSSEATFTRFEFDAMFPDDTACLDWLFNRRYPDGVYCPKCERVTPHYREKTRPSYSCHCGHHVHPMRGTIFEDSATSLRLWFLAIYLIATTRCGISAKHLEREIGVTYKCAWRMNKLIKQMLSEEVLSLLGQIEVDEAFYGGSDKFRHRNKKKGHWEGKTTVFGMIERNGKVVATVLPAPKSRYILPRIKQKILPKSMIFSDEAQTYDPLTGMGYGHKRVHHTLGLYVDGDAHTNTAESFWSLTKRGIDGAHHSVSAEYLQDYLNAYAFRWNHRDSEQPMFFQMLEQIPAASEPEKQDE